MASNNFTFSSRISCSAKQSYISACLYLALSAYWVVMLPCLKQQNTVLSGHVKCTWIQSLSSLKIPQFIIISTRSHIQCDSTINAHKFKTED